MSAHAGTLEGMRRLRTATALAGLALTATTLTACGSSDQPADDKPSTTHSSSAPADTEQPKNDPGLDEAGGFACTDFARYIQDGQPSGQPRLDAVHKVNKWAQRSESGRIADAGDTIANAANGTEGSWKIAADTFAQACFDAGWNGEAT